MDTFYKLLKLTNIFDKGRTKVGIRFGINTKTTLPFVESIDIPKSDGSYWTFDFKEKIITIEQFSFGKQDAQMNAREDNLGMIDSIYEYAPHYKACAKIIEEIHLRHKLKKRRF